MGCTGVCCREKLHSLGMISESERTLRPLGCMSMFSALMRLLVKKLTLSSSSCRVYCRGVVSFYILILFDLVILQYMNQIGVRLVRDLGG